MKESLCRRRDGGTGRGHPRPRAEGWQGTAEEHRAEPQAMGAWGGKRVHTGPHLLLARGLSVSGGGGPPAGCRGDAPWPGTTVPQLGLGQGPCYGLK